MSSKITPISSDIDRDCLLGGTFPRFHAFKFYPPNNSPSSDKQQQQLQQQLRTPTRFHQSGTIDTCLCQSGFFYHSTSSPLLSCQELILRLPSTTRSSTQHQVKRYVDYFALFYNFAFVYQKPCNSPFGGTLSPTLHGTPEFNRSSTPASTNPTSSASSLTYLFLLHYFSLLHLHLYLYF